MVSAAPRCGARIKETSTCSTKTESRSRRRAAPRSDAAGAALAGECPADKMMADVREAVAFEPTGVTDNVLAALPLAEEGPMLADRQMRVRKLVIQPDGIVPWHSHADRPR